MYEKLVARVILVGLLAEFQKLVTFYEELETMENQEKSQNTRNTTIDQGRSRVFYTNKKVKPLKTKKTKKTTINIRKPPSENHVFFYTKKQ